MIYCRNCESYIDEEKLVKKRFYNGEIHRLDTEELCPICRSDDIEDAIKCISCDEYTNKHDAVTGLCVECQTRLQKEAREFIGKYKSEEQEFILEYLNE